MYYAQDSEMCFPVVSYVGALVFIIFQCSFLEVKQGEVWVLFSVYTYIYTHIMCVSVCVRAHLLCELSIISLSLTFRYCINTEQTVVASTFC